MTKRTVVGYRNRRSALALLLVAAGLLGALFWHGLEPELLAASPQAQDNPQPASRAQYVGDAVCASCHQQIGLSYEHTAHHLTSQLANSSSVLGSFHPPANELHLVSSAEESFGASLAFKMEAKPDGDYETASVTEDGQTQTQSARIDIVTGTGANGQTYLSWKGNQLYELPLSYWPSGKQWGNSPGYTDGTADFSRPIYPRCIECHATYIRPLSQDPLTNSYDPQSFVPGISCETCHGPGAEHVTHRRHPQDTAAQASDPFILNPASFSRDRQMDLCAFCHNGGQREERALPFTYIPGQPLDRYLRPESIDMPTHPDVHGNQTGLLERSLCYRSSSMTCSTCHDVHTAGRSIASYSQRCLTCHTVTSCKMSKQLGHKIAGNCIDCHMPKLPTSVIVSKTGERTVRLMLRTHWIKVYPKEVSR